MQIDLICVSAGSSVTELLHHIYCMARLIMWPISTTTVGPCSACDDSDDKCQQHRENVFDDFPSSCVASCCGTQSTTPSSSNRSTNLTYGFAELQFTFHSYIKRAGNSIRIHLIDENECTGKGSIHTFAHSLAHTNGLVEVVMLYFRSRGINLTFESPLLLAPSLSLSLRPKLFWNYVNPYPLSISPDTPLS